MIRNQLEHIEASLQPLCCLHGLVILKQYKENISS